jgi:LysM repeat protein
MNDRSRRLPLLILTALLIVALISAALPTTAKAVTCVRYHTVKSGDTTSKIAQTYGMKWRLIADANDLEYPYKLKTGQKLCIPPGESDDTNQADDLKMTAKSSGNSISITIKGLSTKTSYYVRVRDGTASVRGWYKIGVMRAKKNTTATMSFSLPKELRNVLYIQVCLKNGTTDELACRTIVHQ